MENLILTGKIEGNRDIGKQGQTYIVTLTKWMPEERLREIAKGQNLLRFIKDIVDSHDRQSFQGIRKRRQRCTILKTPRELHLAGGSYFVEAWSIARNINFRQLAILNLQRT